MAFWGFGARKEGPGEGSKEGGARRKEARWRESEIKGEKNMRITKTRKRWGWGGSGGGAGGGVHRESIGALVAFTP